MKRFCRCKVPSQLALKYRDYLGGPDPNKQAFKSRAFSQAGSRNGRSERCKVSEGFDKPLLACGWEGPCGRIRNWRQLQRVTPGQQPTRKQGPSSYNHKKLNSAKNWKDSGSRFFPSLQTRARPKPTP